MGSAQGTTKSFRRPRDNMINLRNFHGNFHGSFHGFTLEIKIDHSQDHQNSDNNNAWTK